MRAVRASPAVLIGLVLVACLGRGGGTPEPSASGPELTTLRVGVLPIVDVAPIYLAIERGLFEAEGLTVTPELVQGGAAAVPALQGGDLDIAYGNWVSFLLANRAGIELRAVAGGVAAAPGFTELLALPDSGLAGDPGGMEGMTVAVNTLNNIGELAVRSTLRDAGADVDGVSLVEVPFPEMGAALERGDVDVIWASEPVPTLVKDSLGAVVVADSFVGEMEGFPVAGYQATAEFVSTHPRTVAAFRRAVAAAVALIEADAGLVAEIVPTYTSLTPELARTIAPPRFERALDVADLARVYEHLAAFGMIDADLDVASLVAAGVPSE